MARRDVALRSEISEASNNGEMAAQISGQHALNQSKAKT
jgi:hypothetical protein